MEMKRKQNRLVAIQTIADVARLVVPKDTP